VRDGDVTATTLAQSIKKKLPRPILIENADADAKDIYFFDIHVLAMILSQGDLRCTKRGAGGYQLFVLSIRLPRYQLFVIG
jgi:hypothetical protein